MKYTFEKTIGGYVMRPLSDVTAIFKGKPYYRNKGDSSGTWNVPIETNATIITEGIVNVEIDDSADVEFRGVVFLKNCDLKITGNSKTVIDNSLIVGKTKISESTISKSTLIKTTVQASTISYSFIFGGIKQTQITFSNIKFADIEINLDGEDGPLTFCDADIKSQFDIVYIYEGKRTEYAYRVKGNGWTDIMFHGGTKKETTRFRKEITSYTFAKDLMSLNASLNETFEKMSIYCIKTLSGFLADNYSHTEHLNKFGISRDEYEKLIQPKEDKMRFLSPEFSTWSMYYQKFLFREIYDEKEILRHFPIDIASKKTVLCSNFALLDKNTAKKLGESILYLAEKARMIKVIKLTEEDKYFSDLT